MNKLYQELKKLTPKIVRVEPAYNNLFNLVDATFGIEEDTEKFYVYDLRVRLGTQVRLMKDEVEAIEDCKDIIYRQLVNELYGEIYSELLNLMTAYYEENRTKQKELIEKLLEMTRS